MKLLLEENLSRRLVASLPVRFPGSSQVVLAGLERESDSVIWEQAREQGFVMVTKDDDFGNLQALHGYPPKIIHLQLGNCTNQQVHDALLKAADRLTALLGQEDIGIVKLAQATRKVPPTISTSRGITQALRSASQAASEHSEPQRRQARHILMLQFAVLTATYGPESRG